MNQEIEVTRTAFIAPRNRDEYMNMTCIILSSEKVPGHDAYRTRIDPQDFRGRIFDVLTSVKLQGRMFTKSAMSTRVRFNKYNRVVPL